MGARMTALAARSATALALAQAMPPGCTGVITPPVNPVDPVEVYIADEGRHAGLILPREGGGAVEYAYGEWEWFALSRDEWWRVPMVLFLPTAGTLGRREVSAEPSPESIRAARVIEALHVVRVSRRDAAALVRKLDERYARHADRMVKSPDYHLEFVRDHEPYSILHHCNTELIAWLGELGCRVRGRPLHASFEVTEPAAAK
jgi:hypothetical protein